MKLHAGTHTIEKSGQFEESKFSIEASSKAFFILSDGLYSNKILAVVRELSTNAYDSHVEAGKKNVPFDVHIPTRLEPTFFIRDYGTSMNHEDCMQLYTTYFRSTRNNSNDAVGCLGLGSKAPFAYADSFTVEAFLDGKRRVYNAFKDEDGNPVFSLMDTFDTDEANGIKVSININEYDIHRFYHEAVKVYEFFNTKPNFIGQSISFKKVNKVLAGDNWYYDADGDQNLIIMGQIAYPLRSTELCQNSEKEYKFVEYSSGLRIFVNIGDVDITPSRESLSYSKDTRKNIIGIVNQIADDIAAKIEEQIANQPSLFKARMKYVQISNQCSSIRSAVESLHKSISWNDHKLFDSIAGEYINLKNLIEVNCAEKSAYRSKVDVKQSVERMVFQENTKFFIDDLSRGGVSRIRQYMKDQSGHQVHYIYKLRDGETLDNCRLLSIMGDAKISDIIPTSTLDKVEYNRTSSGVGGGPAIQAKVFNVETGKFEICNMSVKYENAHYFSESKGDVSVGYRSVDESYLANAIAFAYEKYPDMIGDATFYLVKPSVIKNRKLDERDNWFSGETILTKVFDTAVEANRDNIKDVFRSVPLSLHNTKWIDILKITQTDNLAKKIYFEHKEYSSKIEAMSNDMRIIHEFSKIFPGVNSVDLSENKPDHRFSKQFDSEMNKYPVLRLLGHVWSDTDRKVVADYIDSVERGLHAQNVLNLM
jgi:hypothetical protein